MSSILPALAERRADTNIGALQGSSDPRPRRAQRSTVAQPAEQRVTYLGAERSDNGRDDDDRGELAARQSDRRAREREQHRQPRSTQVPDAAQDGEAVKRPRILAAVAVGAAEEDTRHGQGRLAAYGCRRGTGGARRAPPRLLGAVFLSPRRFRTGSAGARRHPA